MPFWADLTFFFCPAPAKPPYSEPARTCGLLNLPTIAAPPCALARQGLRGGWQALPLRAPAQQHEQWSLIAASALVGTEHRRFLSHEASMRARMNTTSCGTDMGV